MDNEEKKRALIVEDDLTAAYIHSLVVSKMGLCYDKVTDGNEALKKIEDNVFDVILLDVGLDKSGPSGIDVAEKFKNNPKTSDIPIVLISILSTDIGINEQVNKLDNIKRVLKKPVGIDIIEKTVKEVLKI